MMLIEVLLATYFLHISHAICRPSSSDGHPHNKKHFDVPAPSSSGINHQLNDHNDGSMDPNWDLRWAYEDWHTPSDTPIDSREQTPAPSSLSLSVQQGGESSSSIPQSTWEWDPLEQQCDLNIDGMLADLDRSVATRQTDLPASLSMLPPEPIFEYNIDDKDEDQCTAEDEDSLDCGDMVPDTRERYTTEEDRHVILRYWANLSDEVCKDAITLAEATESKELQGITAIGITSVMLKYMTTHDFDTDFIAKFKRRRYLIAKTRNDIPKVLISQSRFSDKVKVRLNKVLDKMRRFGVELDGPIIELEKRIQTLKKDLGPWSYKTWYDAAMYYVAQNRPRQDAALLRRLQSDYRRRNTF